MTTVFDEATFTRLSAKGIALTAGSAASDGGADGHVLHGYAEQIAAQESYRLDLSRDDHSGGLLMANTSVVDRDRMVDVSWLPLAAPEYHISPDIKDYVLAEVPIVEGDVPNRNMNCFLTSRLVQFLPKFGCAAYRTFVGKPTFYEHQHDDNTKAKGVIFDASMRVVNGRSYVVVLKGFDRTKDRKLAEDVLHMRRRGHSMSAWTAYMNCSRCGHRFDTAWDNACQCLRGDKARQIKGKFLGKGQVVDGMLTYDCPDEFYYFESSSVGDPANYGAFQLQQVTM